MKLRALCALNAVNGPSAAVGCEVLGPLRMPVAALINRFTAREKFFDQIVERRYHLIAAWNGQRAARTKIILHINHNQCTFLFIRHQTNIPFSSEWPLQD